MKKPEDQLGELKQQVRHLQAKLRHHRREERILISKRIHDLFGQILTALSLNVTHLKNMMCKTFGEQLPPYLMEEISEIRSQIEKAIRTVQCFNAELRPYSSAPMGIVYSIERFLEEVPKRNGIQVAFHVTPKNFSLDRTRTDILFLIFQEGILNVIRHAQAKILRVLLQKTGGENIQLTIADNGKGMTKDKISDARSIGITDMRERAEQLGGTFKITSRKGKGTSIVIEFPELRARLKKCQGISPCASIVLLCV